MLTCLSKKNIIILGRDCNPVSTGAILLADILPAILVKAVAPFLHLKANRKVHYYSANYQMCYAHMKRLFVLRS